MGSTYELNVRQTKAHFFNYKQYFSIILQGVEDANCRFLAIDVGAGENKVMEEC